MKIQAFIDDKDAVQKWLSAEAQSVEARGFFFSHWFHDDGLGFGITITAVKSGEFHLMANGDVSSYTEMYNQKTQEIDALNSEQRPTAHVHEFEEMYASFKNMVTSDA